MSDEKSLIGKKYGKWTVVARDNTRNSAYWICDCECGTSGKSIRENALISGTTKSCGCSRKLNITPGDIYGRLVVIERASKSGYWICNCKCGNEGKIISGSNLIYGKTKSCGCLNSELAKVRTYIDLTGMTIGKLKVKYRDGNRKRTYWICDCTCGNNDISISSESLRSGKKNSCGCEKEERYSLIGKEFGRLVVTAKSDKRASNGDSFWICDCSCGNKNIFVMRSNLVAKNKYKTLSCGCYKNDGEHVINRESDRENHIVKYLYGKLKVRNKKLGFDNSEIINFDMFQSMIFKECYYCGLENGNTTYDTGNKKRVSDTVLHHSGIDRIDSNKGYVIGNVVPCCKYCNMAKMDRSQDEFLEWAEHTYQYFVQGIRENP